MKKITIFLMTAWVLIPPGLAGDDQAWWEQIHTNKQVNGRFWNEATLDGKAIFLMAFSDGLDSLMESCDDSKAKFRESFPWALRNAEIMKSIDKFYQTPENVRIPIYQALILSAARLRGVDEPQIDTFVLQMRAEAAGSPAPIAIPAAQKQ